MVNETTGKSNNEKIAVAIILGAIILGAFIIMSNQSITIYLVENASLINTTFP